MIGRSTGETYRLGDRVTVRLVEAIPVAGALALRSAFERPAANGRVRTRLRARAAAGGPRPDANRTVAAQAARMNEMTIECTSGAERDGWPAFLRGLRGRCPACGQGRMFRALLKVNDHCPSCGEALHHHRADDAPAYFNIVIVGHIVVPLVLSVETAFAPALLGACRPLAAAHAHSCLRADASDQGRGRRLAMGDAHARLRSRMRRRRRSIRRRCDASQMRTETDTISRTD